MALHMMPMNVPADEEDGPVTEDGMLKERLHMMALVIVRCADPQDFSCQEDRGRVSQRTARSGAG
jgi:hypothetical protein